MTAVETPPAQVERDRYGRPLVIPPGGDKKVAYRRATTYIDVLDNRYALEKWKQRQVAAGMAGRSDLVVQAASAAGDKAILNQVAESAMEAAGSSAAATTGTAVHRLTEQLDGGQQPTVPEAHAADLQAYALATADLTVCDMELFVVDDERQVGGTFDRLMSYHDGLRMIADIKTGSTLDWTVGKIEMQLALYAGSQRYDPATGARSPLDVSQDWGLVIHLPAGQGVCRVWWVNLGEGRFGLDTAQQVWRWRARHHAFARELVPLHRQIAQAPTVETLRALWQVHRTQWTEAHTEAAAARKKELLASTEA